MSDTPFDMSVQQTGDIISNATANEIISFIQNIIEIMCAIGIVLNVINFIIFYQQGLTSATNITLSSLAVADFFNLAIVGSGLLCHHSFIVYTFPYPVSGDELAAYVATPHSSMARIRSWIYVFMTAERCLCIALPLKIKQIITPRRSATVIVAIYLFNLAFVIPLYCDMYVDWKYYPSLNQTRLGVKFRYDRTYITTPVYLASSLVSMTSFATVVLLTSVLIWKLHQLSQWRDKSINSVKSDRWSQRDTMVIRLVVVIASVLIIFLSPSMVYYLLGFISVDFSTIGSTGKYKNSMHVYGWLAYLLDVVHSCVNIFIYYRMNSSYRRTFQKNVFSSVVLCRHLYSVRCRCRRKSLLSPTP